MPGWSDDELRAAVGAYLEMAASQAAGRPYSKAAFRRRLMAGPLESRGEPSIEYRMRNISAVMAEHGREVLRGYLPAANVGPEIRTRLWTMVREFEARRPRKRGAGRGEERPPIVFFNVGWMRTYGGATPGDPTRGGHAWLTEHEYGGEAFNFAAVSGRVRGYRPGFKGLKIERLGAARGDASVDGVLVIWMAREPKTKRTLIVGWYRNATVHRVSRPTERVLDGEPVQYAVEADVADSRLLPVLARTYRIESSRTAEEGFGQSPVWYGAETVNRRVWDYVLAVEAGAARSHGRAGRSRPPRNQDPELRRRVELAAVEHATAYYESAEGGGCTVTSVEALGRGWDLEVDSGDEVLLVEVKGLSGDRLVCELTPNEYAMMQDRAHRDRYVVYVVCNALDAPIASVFRRSRAGSWVAVDGRVLDVAERTGAVLSAD